jgi:hypothetical protein
MTTKRMPDGQDMEWEPGGQGPEKYVFCRRCGEMMLIVPEGTTDHETICAECIKFRRRETQRVNH